MEERKGKKVKDLGWRALLWSLFTGVIFGYLWSLGLDWVVVAFIGMHLSAALSFLAGIYYENKKYHA